MHSILRDLRQGICSSALEWVQHELNETNSELEFQLRKEEYIRLLLAGSRSIETEPLLPQTTTSGLDTNVEAALRYGGIHFRPFLTNATRRELIGSLLTASIYMPLPKLLSSPYAHLFQPYASDSTSTEEDTELCGIFATAFLKKMGLGKDSALSVVVDIGASGAMAKIQKVRDMMKEKKTEWSAVGELPVSHQYSHSNRY